jgi:hypothetical protein
MAHRKLPSTKFLRECFDYDPNKGNLKWRERPLKHFSCKRTQRHFNNRFVGKTAGYNRPDLYKKINLKYRNKVRTYQLHRVIWKIHHGEDPGKHQVDHIDRNPSNNKICNLRLATQSQNTANTKKKGNQRYKGVTSKCSPKRKLKYRAQIQVEGKKMNLGHFRTAKEAALRYDEVAKQHFGEYAHTNF